MKSLAKGKTRPPADLPKHILDRLAPYAVAAGAALAVAATPANAEVVYHSTDVILRNGMSVRIQDVTAVTFSTSTSHVESGKALRAKFAGGGATRSSQAWGGPGTHAYAAKLGSGASIGPNIMIDSAPIQIDVGFQEYGSGVAIDFSYGPWQVSSTPGYLGFRFTLRGKTHYGWLRMTVSTGRFGIHLTPTDFVFSATLNGFAYETTPNKPILAGDETGAMVGKNKPQAALGFLALGSAAIPFWRKQ